VQHLRVASGPRDYHLDGPDDFLPYRLHPESRQLVVFLLIMQNPPINPPEPHRRKTITLLGPSEKKFRFKCQDVIKDIAINPVLPGNFDNTPNEERSPRSLAWWNVPYVVTYIKTVNGWEIASSGAQEFHVRCLDGGAWDRSTWLGTFATLEEALALATTPQELRPFPHNIFRAGPGPLKPELLAAIQRDYYHQV